jgi:hypothetical protein
MNSERRGWKGVNPDTPNRDFASLRGVKSMNGVKGNRDQVGKWEC